LRPAALIVLFFGVDAGVAGAFGVPDGRPLRLPVTMNCFATELRSDQWSLAVFAASAISS
jgi:hypothetical protein